jgi:hypothetical protein
MKKYVLAVYNQRGSSNPYGGGIEPVLAFTDARPAVFRD